MIKAIEIKTIEKCPYYKGTYYQDGNNFCSHDSLLCCLGLDSPDCPLNAIRCGSCKHKSYCSVYHVVNEAISEDGFCSGYEVI